jgi:hypothetical protein
MSSELERRLTRLLASQPRSTPTVKDQAREAALGALAPTTGRSRPAASLVLGAAAAVVVMTGVALAATRTSFPGLGRSAPPAPPTSHRIPVIQVPGGAAGFSVQVDGRLWVATPAGLALRAVPLRAAATSPRALYAVGQTAERMNAVSITDHHVAWSVPLDGRLVAAAWSPYPIRIAYVVDHRNGTSVLHSIWGNGTNDQVIGPAARVKPAWRWDSLAVAYTAPGGSVMLSTVSAAPRRINRSSACGGGRITELAFAPHSPTLAETTDRSRLILVDTRHPHRVSCISTDAPPTGVHWISATNLVYGRPAGAELTRIALRHNRVVASGTTTMPGVVLGITTAPRGHTIAVAIRGETKLLLLLVEPPELGETAPARPRERLRLPIPAGRIVRISWS